ncbi:Sodium-coupled monocarboxylate transporter 1 [Araneus ventricosus]|uniref:Sodium-coupled monocarboxylate transporter 1 n=1 Tax=Araneus ventricosus TaxID=182803 RepID=A0A4Y2Q803_ARAVE|nr:Sodium-coupled monocarboxylate transporter 1 [Araneus ventricosus]
MVGISQTGVQRFFSLSKIGRAKTALLITNPLMNFLFLSACLHGIIMYAVYFKCDPILNSSETGLTNHDQIVPYFLVSKFHSIPGLTGLSVAGIFSGSLTTISSVLNSLATVTVIDFVHPIFQSLESNEKKSLLLAKGLALAYGAICICIALALTKISSLAQVGFLFHNTFEGPSLAIFTIGVMTRIGFGKSVLFSLLPGFAITQWIGFSSLFSGYNEPPLPLNTSMCSSTFNLTYDYSASEVSNIISPSTTLSPASQRSEQSSHPTRFKISESCGKALDEEN